MPSIQRPTTVADITGVKLPFEIILQFALVLDGRDLFNFLEVNNQIRSLYSDQVFWEKKLNISRKGIPVQSLRRLYNRRYRAIGSLEGKCMHTSIEDSIAEGEVMDKLCISEAESGPALFVRSRTDGNAETEIFDFRSDLRFEDQLSFTPDKLFDCGKLCLGEGEYTKVIYCVKDWSLVAQLDTDPNDTWLSTHGARSVWSIVGPDSASLLRIHQMGDSAGKIEVWDSTVKTCRGIIWHPEISGWVSLPGSEQFLTVDKNGNIRVWDMCHFTYRNLLFDLGGIGPLVTIKCHGNILEFVTKVDKIYHTTYCHLHNQSLPPRLQGTLTSRSPDSWVAFSDGTYVLGDIVDEQYCFSIFTSGGKEEGSFQHSSSEDAITFMDRYIVTVACGGDLRIWSKQGVLLFTTYLGYRHPVLVEGEVGCLFALEFCQGSFSRYKTWDFTDDNKGKNS